MKIINISFDEKIDSFIIETESTKFQVSYKDYEKYKLKKDMIIDAELEKELVKIESKNKVYSDALFFISYRMRTKKEIKDKLSKKYSEEMIEEVLLRLDKEGFIDDRHFTKLYIQSKLNLNKWSFKKIKYHLIQLGVENSLIDEELMILNSDHELDNARDLLQKKIVQWKKKYENHYELKNKIYNFLSYRGYSYDTINTISKEFVDE